MPLSLYDVVDLPPETPMSEFASAVDVHFHAAFEKAARGDAGANDELLELRVAYLNWAYRQPTPRK